jgi:hypothetical protein
VTIHLRRDETRIIKLFADGESDPHRVRFWRIVVSVDGLKLQPELEPGADAEVSEASWHELHDMMHAKDALLEDLDELKSNIAVLERDIVLLRTHWHRLKRIVNARQVDVGDARVLDLCARIAERAS